MQQTEFLTKGESFLQLANLTDLTKQEFVDPQAQAYLFAQGFARVPLGRFKVL